MEKMNTIFKKTLIAAALATVAANATATLTVDSNSATTGNQIWFVANEELMTTTIHSDNLMGGMNVDTKNSVSFKPALDNDNALIVTLVNAAWLDQTGRDYYLCVDNATTTATAGADATGTSAAATLIPGVISLDKLTFAAVGLEAANSYNICNATDNSLAGVAEGFGISLLPGSQTAGKDVTINFDFAAKAINDDTATIATYANALVGSISTTTDFDDTIDAISNDALNFGGTTTKDLSDTLVATVGTNANETNAALWNTAGVGTEIASLTYSLTGLPTATSGVVLDLATDEKLTNVAGVYSITSTSATAAQTLVASVDGTTAITASSPKLTLTANPATNFLTTTTYLNAASAGSWALNGLEAKIAYMPVNYSTITPIIKIANESTTDAKVIISATGNMIDGEVTTPVSFTSMTSGVVATAGTIASLTSATLTTTLGLDATKKYQLELSLLITGAADSVHIAAQYKDENNGGRVAVPVLYSGATRTFNQ
jgi:hypothetical protein